MAKRRTIKIVDTETAIKALRAGEIIIDDHPIFSNTRTEISSRCMKQYALNYFFHVPAKITPDVARGDLLHKVEHALWVIDEKTGLLVPGYKSYESCVKCTRRDWNFQYAVPGKSPKGSEIEWKSRGQRYGNWYANEVANLAGLIYSRFLIEEPRIFSELEINGVEIKAENKEDTLYLMAKLDEVRTKMTEHGLKIVIRDHKSGLRNYSNPDFLDTNTQMTHYAICLHAALQDSTSEVYKMPELKNFRNMSLEDFLQNLIIQINHISDYRKNKEEDQQAITQLYETTRTMRDVKELLYRLRSTQSALRRRDFPENRLRCPACFWKGQACRSFDMQAIFHDDYRKTSPLFANSDVLVDTSFKPKVKKYRKQKTMRFPKPKDKQLSLRLPK